MPYGNDLSVTNNISSDLTEQVFGQSLFDHDKIKLEPDIIALITEQLTKMTLTFFYPDRGQHILIDASRLIGQHIPDGPIAGKMGKDQLMADTDITNYFFYAANIIAIPGSYFNIQKQAGYFCISCEKDKKIITRNVFIHE